MLQESGIWNIAVVRFKNDGLSISDKPCEITDTMGEWEGSYAFR